LWRRRIATNPAVNAEEIPNGYRQGVSELLAPDQERPCSEKELIRRIGKDLRDKFSPLATADDKTRGRTPRVGDMLVADYVYPAAVKAGVVKVERVRMAKRSCTSTGWARR
jgi:hypothetical protein